MHILIKQWFTMDFLKYGDKPCTIFVVIININDFVVDIIYKLKWSCWMV
jgi:hypothetical protein